MDELAHTNVPGSKHRKRYQDVEELLLRRNPRHHDRERAAPGEPLRRGRAGHRREGQGAASRPVLAEADQIVNVDVSAEDLIERLKAGKVYPPDRAERRSRTSSRPRT